MPSPYREFSRVLAHTKTPSYDLQRPEKTFLFEAYDFTGVLPRPKKIRLITYDHESFAFIRSRFYGANNSQISKYFDKQLTETTRVPKKIFKAFARIYELALRCRKYRLKPAWIKQYKVLFFSDLHLVSFSVRGIFARSMRTWDDVLYFSYHYDRLKIILLELFKVQEYLLHMYDEGRGADIKDPYIIINRLYALKVIDRRQYKDLLFVYSIEVPSDPELPIFDTENTRILFVTLIAQLYLVAMKLYMRMQEPFLLKFDNLVRNQTLNDNQSVEDFYRFY